MLSLFINVIVSCHHIITTCPIFIIILACWISNCWFIIIYHPCIIYLFLKLNIQTYLRWNCHPLLYHKVFPQAQPEQKNISIFMYYSSDYKYQYLFIANMRETWITNMRETRSLDWIAAFSWPISHNFLFSWCQRTSHLIIFYI